MTIDRELRQNRVLEAIIRAHTESALPVGSKYISKVLNLSSATIRNVMFELEREGLVKQPHTSAGRIPTDLGYRRYVDSVMSVRELPGDDFFSCVKQYANGKKVFEEIIEATSQAISRITNYTGIVLSPNNKLYFDGTYHMLEQPEFRASDMALDLIRIMEERDELLQIMNENLSISGTVIHIGRENIFDELRECSIVTASYKFHDRVSGNLGVIGPIRMKYEEVVPIVEHLAELTTEILEGLSV